jgi:DNA helicase-2/ATP-dependent DNA helicase PcrA
MVVIPEYKRDKSADERLVLEGISQIPFPAGKNLLADFLHGESNNASIEKNNLFDLDGFGSMDYMDKYSIINIIEKLSDEGLIESSPSVFNKESKVLSVSQNGKNKSLWKARSEAANPAGDEITREEIISLKELDSFLSGFNDDQKRAIVSRSQKILCIAGAGSGKTMVLTKRVEFLAKLKRIKSERILAITFTRKAKEEMERRLKKSGMTAVVETFNSFCEKILLKNTAIIYGKKMKVAGKEDKIIAVLRALGEIGLELPEAIGLYFSGGEKPEKDFYELQNIFISDVFEVFEKFRISGISAEEFKKIYFGEKGEDKIEDMIHKMIVFLEKYMASAGLRTYADQVKDTINFFKIHPKKTPKFDHILVDEFQDVNEEQAQLLNVLNPENLFCVGDPRQSIFGWRGSQMKYIINFRKSYPEAQIIMLKKNYRSNRNIIEFINSSIKEMGFPGLEANFDGKKEIKILQFSSESEEFVFVKDKIAESKIPRKEIFVLARTNRELQSLSALLKKSGIKHVIKSENRNEIDAKEDEVTLSTIHSIKGLEAETVFVVGCTPLNFPPRYNEHPIIGRVKLYNYDEKAEEKRLFYVAISRAKNSLYLTYSGKRHTYFISSEMEEIAQEDK